MDRILILSEVEGPAAAAAERLSLSKRLLVTCLLSRHWRRSPDAALTTTF